MFGSGIDRIGNILDCANDLGIVQRKGSWFSYKSQNLAQGRHNAVQLLKQDLELQQQLEAEVRLALADLGKKPTDEDDEPVAKKEDKPGSASSVVESLEGLESGTSLFE